LFAYRNTPNSVTGLTPAELFLNRKPKTKLALLKPNLQADIDKKLDKQKEYSNRHRGPPRYFEEGEKVLVKTVRQEKISWVPGKILARKSPVVYLVSVLGKTRWCHSDHLRSQRLEDLEDELSIWPGNAEKNVTPSNSPYRNREELRPVNIQVDIEDKIPPSESQQESPRTRASLGHQSEEDAHGDPVVQCSPPQLRKSGRTVRKPDRLNL